VAMGGITSLLSTFNVPIVNGLKRFSKAIFHLRKYSVGGLKHLVTKSGWTSGLTTRPFGTILVLHSQAIIDHWVVENLIIMNDEIWCLKFGIYKSVLEPLAVFQRILLASHPLFQTPNTQTPNTTSFKKALTCQLKSLIKLSIGGFIISKEFFMI
jgi:hypothetical protein